MGRYPAFIPPALKNADIAVANIQLGLGLSLSRGHGPPSSSGADREIISSYRATSSTSRGTGTVGPDRETARLRHRPNQGGSPPRDSRFAPALEPIAEMDRADLVLVGRSIPLAQWKSG